MDQIREEARKNVEMKKQQRDQQRFQQQQLEKETERTEYTENEQSSMEESKRQPMVNVEMAEEDKVHAQVDQKIAKIDLFDTKA